MLGKALLKEEHALTKEVQDEDDAQASALHRRGRWHCLGEERLLHRQQVDAVDHVQDLPFSRKLVTDPLGNQHIVPRAYVGPDRRSPPPPL